MTKLRVAVLRGGPSSEYDVSLKSGGAVLKHLPEKYHGHDIFISKDGTWHRDGMEKSPERALAHVDVVFNALHGEYGEDGKVQQILDALALPYTGSGSMASAVGMNKILSKNAFTHHGLKTPYHTVIRHTDNLKEKVSYAFHHFFLPIVVKPATSGSSMGVSIVKNFNHLEEAFHNAFQYSDTVLMEEYIRGKEATCGVIDGLRGETHYILPPVEIIHPSHTDHFDYESKYNGKTQEIYPGNFTALEKAEIQRLAKLAHESLGLRHYSRSDFIVTPRRGVYILEVNTLPGLTPQSLLPQSLESIGVSFPDFLEHLITLAHTHRR
ncbi:MAG: D-alanine--D-alanine ligase [Patescibacteria group bacterium]